MVGGGVVFFTGPGGMTEAMHEVSDRVSSVAMASVSYPKFESWSGKDGEAEALSYLSGFPDSRRTLIEVGFGEGTNAACSVVGNQRVGAAVLVNGVGHVAISGGPWPADVWLDLVMFETGAPFFGDRAEAEALARRTARAELIRLPAHRGGLASTAIQSAVVDAITPVASKAGITFGCDADRLGRPAGWGTATVSRDARDGFSIEVDCEDGQLLLSVGYSERGLESQVSFRSEQPQLGFDQRMAHRSLASALSHVHHVLVVAYNALAPDPSEHTVSDFLAALRSAWEQQGHGT